MSKCRLEFLPPASESQYFSRFHHTRVEAFKGVWLQLGEFDFNAGTTCGVSHSSASFPPLQGPYESPHTKVRARTVLAVSK